MEDQTDPQRIEESGQNTSGQAVPPVDAVIPAPAPRPNEYKVDANNRITEKLEPDYRFWNRLGSNFDSGIGDFAGICGIEDNLVFTTAIIGVLNEDGRTKIGIDASKESPVLAQTGKDPTKWLEQQRKNTAWFILIGILLLLTGIIGFRVYTVFFREIIVRKPGGIKIYTKIGPHDLYNNQPGRDVVGRFVLSPIPYNDFLVEKDLLSKELSCIMKGRQIVSITIENGILNGSLTPNSKADILFTDGQNPAKITSIENLVVLGVEKKENVSILTVGIAPDKLQLLNQLPNRNAVSVIADQ